MENVNKLMVFLLVIISIIAINSSCGTSPVTSDVLDSLAADLPSYIASVFPASKAKSVPISTKITVTFAKSIDIATIGTSTFTLTNESGLINGSVTYNDANKIATFTPNSILLPSKTYTAKINGAIRDSNGNRLDQDYMWSFTTGSQPEIKSVFPADGATSITTKEIITIKAVFSESMDVDSIKKAFTITQYIDGVSTPEKLTGNITYDAVTFTAYFTPSKKFSSGLIMAAISKEAISSAGNNIGMDFSWVFITERGIGGPGTEPPGGTTGNFIGRVSPADAETNVVVPFVDIVFVKAMKATSINSNTFTVTSASGPASGTVTYESSLVPGTSMYVYSATFAFNGGSFSPSTKYTAKLDGSVTDNNGTAMGTSYTWSFTTSSSVGTTPGSQTGINSFISTVSPSNEQTSVDIIPPFISVFFSKSMDSSSIDSTKLSVSSPLGSFPGTFMYIEPIPGIYIGEFNGDSVFSASTTYTATLDASIKDKSGNQMGTPYTWKFTTKAQ